MASLIEELVDTLDKEYDSYVKLLPVVKEKTGIIVADDLEALQKITEKEQTIIEEIMGLEKKREQTVKKYRNCSQ